MCNLIYNAYFIPPFRIKIDASQPEIFFKQVWRPKPNWGHPLRSIPKPKRSIVFSDKYWLCIQSVYTAAKRTWNIYNLVELVEIQCYDIYSLDGPS